MKENNKNIIDEIFRQKLKDYSREPSSGIWDKIQDSLDNSTADSGEQKGFIERKRWFGYYFKSSVRIAAAALFLTAIIITAYYFYPFNKPSAVSEQTSAVGEQPSAVSSQQSAVSSQQSAVSSQQSASGSEQISASGSSHQSAVSSQPAAANYIREDANKELQTIEYAGIENISRMRQIVSGKIGGRADSAIYYYYKRLEPRESLLQKAAYRQKPDIYAGIHLSGEYYISRTAPFSNRDDYANAADISLTFAWQRFAIRTGIGLSFYNTDKSDYEIDYFKQEQIGTYERVDSVDFKLQNNAAVPEFHTTQIKVYDEVFYTYKSKAINRYTYLQIPLLVSYRIKDLNKLSFMLNAGPVVSLSLYKKTEEITYPGDGATILTVYRDEIKRMNAYWDMMFSIGIDYKLSNRLNILAEPMLRTSLTSVYSETNQQMKKPYSVGLRSGIMYKF